MPKLPSHKSSQRSRLKDTAGLDPSRNSDQARRDQDSKKNGGRFIRTLARYFGLGGLLVVLHSCTSTPSIAPQTALRTEAAGDPTRVRISSVAEGLRLANAAQEPAQSQMLSMTARLALENGDIETSQRLLATVAQGYLLPDQLTDYLLTKSQIEYHEGNYESALSLLNDRAFNRLALTESKQIETSLLLADAYLATNRFYASARERVLVHHLLKGNTRTANSNAIYETLLSLPTPILTAYAKKAVSNEFRGWLSLSAMAKQFQNRPSQQLRALGNWKKLWVGHPAAGELPESLTFLDSVVAEQPKILGLLLPQSGPLASAGEAIISGIMAAHFDLGEPTEIRVYDSHQVADPLDLIKREADQGVDFFIGPLDKAKVSRLAKARLPVPVLALNRINPTRGERPNGNLFLFGLAPEDEAGQIARRAEKERRSQTLVIAPSNDWGDRSVAAFQSTLSSGTTTATVARYDEGISHAEFVRQILRIDESQNRAAELRRMIGKSFEFTPRRRQDLSLITLLSDAGDARQLSPALAFYYADDLPVYATSLVNDLTATKINNLDLNGIQFLDIPWKLLPKDDLGEAVVNAWPAASGTLGPLFAMGMDSYNLMPRLKQLREFPSTRFYGATGTITISDQSLIRELTWATMINGEVQVTDYVMESHHES